MTNVFFKFWRIGSAALVTIVLLFCYTTLPDTIAFGHDEAGNAVNFVEKQKFFYWAAAVIFGVNFLVGLLENAVVKLDFRSLLKNSSWGKYPASTRAFFKGWFSAFLAFVNTYLVFVILGLNNINSTTYKELDFNYNYLLLLGLLIMLIILVFIPYKLLATEAPANED